MSDVDDGLVDALDHAQVHAVPITRQTGLEPLDVGRAYAVQHAGLARRLDRGENRTGVKLGFTSRAKMIQMGVDELIVGQLTDAMRVHDGDALDLDRLIHPRVEPEIAFRLARDVDPRDPLEDLRSAVDAVAPALEVIDSRYEGFSFSLPGVIADNTSAAAYVVGPWAAFGPDSPLDIANLAVVLDHGGGREFGSTAAILGHPLRTLPALLRMAARHGVELRRGFTVLAGAATAAVPLRAGTTTALVHGLGRVVVDATGGPHG